MLDRSSLIYEGSRQCGEETQGIDCCAPDIDEHGECERGNTLNDSSFTDTSAIGLFSTPSSDDDQASLASSREEEDGLGALQELATELLELLPALEQTYCHLLLPKVDRKKRPIFSISQSALPFVQSIADRFKDADPRLIQRLGEANWQRFQEIRARKEPSEPIFKGEVPQSVFTPQTLFHDSGIGTSIATQSLKTPTVASHTSFATTVGESDHGNFRVPKTPSAVSRGESFECDICHGTIRNVENRIQWKMHVFQDLKPYLCTFPDCIEQLTKFATREQWASHELAKHRVIQTWSCPECQEIAASPQELEEHLLKDHKNLVAHQKAKILVGSALCTRPAPIELQSCPLCLSIPGKTRRAFVTHVAKHMESAALAVLPREVDGDSDGSDFSSHTVNSRLTQISRNPEGLPKDLKSGTSLPALPGRSTDTTKTLQLMETTCGRMKGMVKFRELLTAPFRPAHFSINVANCSLQFSTEPSSTERRTVIRNLRGCAIRTHRNEYTQSHFLIVTTGSSDYVQFYPSPPETFDAWLAALLYWQRLDPKKAPTDKLAPALTAEEYHGTRNAGPRFCVCQNEAYGDMVLCSNEECQFRMFHESCIGMKASERPVNWCCVACTQGLQNLTQSQMHAQPSGPPLAINQFNEQVAKARRESHVPRPASESSAKTHDSSVEIYDRKGEEPSGDSLFTRPRCQRCRESRKGCDRQRPCQRCKGAGIGIEGCISENEGRGPRGGHTRHSDTDVKETIEPAIDSPFNENTARAPARRKRSVGSVKQELCCKECDKIFRRLCDLTYVLSFIQLFLSVTDSSSKHEKTHSRPWKCAELNCKYHKYGWPTEKERDRHMNDKHSAAPTLFKCHFHPCPYESKRERNCKQHMEKAHGWIYVRPATKDKTEKLSIEEEEYPIKCICNFQDDDGNIILCETCDTWQHIDCYYQLDTVPGKDDSHYCVNCEPRQLNAHAANKRQRAKR